MTVPFARLLDLTRIVANPDELAWTPFREGVRASWIGEGGGCAAFLRYDPGAGVPLHEHVGQEHIMVLAGYQEDDHGRYLPGTLVVNPAGSRHAIRCPEGALVLAFWERPVRFL